MELSVEKEMCQMSVEQEDSLLEKTLKIKKGIFCCVRNLGHTNIFRFQENVSG